MDKFYDKGMMGDYIKRRNNAGAGKFTTATLQQWLHPYNNCFFVFISIFIFPKIENDLNFQIKGSPFIPITPSWLPLLSSLFPLSLNIAILDLVLTVCIWEIFGIACCYIL